jgi:hypothetical protein
VQVRQAPLALVAALVVAAVGIIDAAAGSNLDLVVVFVAVVVLVGLELLRSWRDRHCVALRSDVSAWLAARAATTDETVTDLASRAISAYRVGLVGDRPADEVPAP